MNLAILCAALIQTAACVLCMALCYQIGFREGEQIEREKHTEDDGPIEMEHRYGCAYRQAGCHSVCERYISWKKELEAEKAYSKQFAPIDAMNLTHEQEKKNRQKRYKRGNQ